jgi:transposase
MCTENIHHAMAEKNLLPAEHFVDAAYVSAELLADSQADYGVDLIGPPRDNPK